jgi:transmembrane sensor
MSQRALIFWWNGSRVGDLSRSGQRRDAKIRAEAAAWLARVHSDDATDIDIQGFQQWTAEDIRHRQAFDAITSVWEAVGGIDDQEERKGEHHENRPRVRRRTLVFTALAGGLLPISWTLARWSSTPKTGAPVQPARLVYSAAIGEQRRVVLTDGSLVTIDSDSAFSTDRTAARSVHHLKGRVNFEVTHDPQHPFVVFAGDARVVVRGTSFDVIRSDNSLGVVLISGNVEVLPAVNQLRASAILLGSPGERLRVDSAGAVTQDMIDIAAATAWQSGRLVFDNETVADAVAEMNRYSSRPIVVAPDVGQLRVSGNYRAGDSEGFATSLAALLPVSTTYEPNRMVIAMRPKGSGGN